MGIEVLFAGAGQSGLAPFSQTTASSSPGSISIGGGFIFAIIGLLALIGVLAVVGVLVIVIVANRADPDPSGRRPLSVYLFGVSFLTLIATVVGSIIVVVSLVQLIGSHHGFSPPGTHPIGDEAARGAVLGGLITLVSLGVLRLHLGRGLRFATADGPAGPSQRVARSYVAAVAFVSVLVLVVAAIAVVYLLFSIAGPGVFSGGTGRIPDLRTLLVALYVAAVAVVVLATHRNLVTPGLGFRRESLAGPTAGTDVASGPA